MLPTAGLSLDDVHMKEGAGDEVGALRLAEQLVRRSPTDALARVEAGRLRLRLGERLSVAELNLEIAVSLVPENPRAHYLLGLTQEADGRLGPAAESLRTAVALRPEFEDAAVRLGQVLMRANDARGAVAVLSPLVKKASGPVGIRLTLSTALEQAGDVAAAEKLLVAMYKNPSTRERARLPLERFYRRHGKADAADKLVLKAARRPLKPSAR